MQNIQQALDKLDHSKFRSSFHLTKKEKEYLEEKGKQVIESHARDFVKLKLSAADPINDGKQTPMKGHPVFLAMHACGCCCRGCLEKWYRVKQHVPLSELQQEKIVNLLMAWIEREVQKYEEAGRREGEPK